MAKRIGKEEVFNGDLFQQQKESAKELLNATTSLRKEFEKLLALQKNDVKANPLGTAQDLKTFDDQLKKTNSTIKTTQDLQKEEVRIKKQLNQLSDEEVKGKIRFQQANKRQKDELKDLIVLEDQQAGTLQRLAAQNRQLRREREGLNLETEKGRQRLQQINAQIDLNNNKLKESSDQFKQARLNVGNYGSAVSQLSPQFAIIQTRLLTITNLLKGVSGGFGKAAAAQQAAATSTNAFTKALKVFRLALISTGIGAIVVALGSLASAIFTTQRGMDALNRFLKPITVTFSRLFGVIQDFGLGILDSFKKALSNPIQALKDLGRVIIENIINRFKAALVFGEAISLLFQGEFTAAAKKGADAAIQFATGVEQGTDKLVDATKAAGEFIKESNKIAETLTNLRISIEEQEIALTRNEAILRRTFETQRELAASLRDTDPIKALEALNKARLAQNQLLEEQQALLDARIEEMKLEQSLNDTSREDELELAKLEAERINFETQASKKRRSLLTEELTLRRAITKQVEEQKKEEELRADIIEKSEKNIQKIKQGTVKIDEESDEARDKRIDDQIKKSGEAFKKQQEQEAQDKEQRDKDLEDEKKKQIEFAKETTNKTIEEIQKRKDAEISAQERVVQEREKAVNTQRRLAEQGLENQLAFEEKKLAEAELKRQELERERLRQEKILAYFNLLSGFAENDPDNASAKALAQILIAETISGAFATGVENFQGKGTETSDSNLIRFSHGESVVTAKGTKENQGLVTAMNEGNVYSWFKDNYLPKMSQEHVFVNSGTSFINPSQFGLMVDKIDSLEKALKNKREYTVNWDSFDKRVTETVENGMKTVKRDIVRRPRLK